MEMTKTSKASMTSSEDEDRAHALKGLHATDSRFRNMVH